MLFFNNLFLNMSIFRLIPVVSYSRPTYFGHNSIFTDLSDLGRNIAHWYFWEDFIDIIIQAIDLVNKFIYLTHLN